MAVPSPIVVTIVGKPGCHLCDDAMAVVAQVTDGLADVVVEQRSILDDPVLHERHWDEIPVVLIDGAVHTIWRVDPQRLTAALAAAAG